MIIFKNRKMIVYIASMLLISRIFIYLTGYIGNNLFSDYTAPPEFEKVAQSGWESTSLKLPEMLRETRLISLDDMVKFDSFYYLDIVENGYNKFKIGEPHDPANWVFYPLYPILIYSFAKALSLDSKIVSIALSNIFLLFGLIFVYLICRERGIEENNIKKVLFFILIFPASLYYSVPYTESLFLLLSSATIFFTLKKDYKISLLLAGLSMVARAPGFINLFYVVLSIIIDKKYRGIIKDPKLVLSMVVSVIPICLYFLYMKTLTGDFLAPIHEQAINWARSLTLPFSNILYYFINPYFISFGGWDNGLISFIISISVFVIYFGYFIKNRRRILKDKDELLFFLYGLLILIISFSSSCWLISTIRYTMLCIPFYIYLADFASKNELINNFYLLLFMTMNVIITTAFFNNYFFAV